MFDLMRAMGFDTLMLWPLSPEDAQVLRGWREVVGEAKTRRAKRKSATDKRR